MTDTHIIIEEQVYHHFTLDQLPAELQARINAQLEGAEDNDLSHAIEDWFCTLTNPFGEANYAEVSDRTVQIERETPPPVTPSTPKPSTIN